MGLLMKTEEFIGKVEEMGYKVSNGWLRVTGKDLKDEYEELMYIHKGDENRIHVGLRVKWLVKNDYYGFAALSAKEKDELMKVVFEYIATEPEDRN